MHKIYCILGRTASGKTSITRGVAKALNMTALKSYTTRALRDNETIETSDHIHIDPDTVEKYRKDMIAYTERVGYCSFACRKQLLEADFYVINPASFYELKENTKDMDIELIPIYITTPFGLCSGWAKKRGDLLTWKANYDKEYDEFSQFEKSGMIYYRVLNDGTIEEAVRKMVNIIEKERKKI